MAWRAEKIANGEEATLDDATVKTIITGKDYVGTLGETSFTTKEGHTILYKDLYNAQTPTGGAGVEAGKIVEETKKDNYKDGENKTATVPAGFTVSGIPSEQTISTGLVIYDIPEDEVESVDWTTKNEDGAYQVQTLYNQFVWIPVATSEEYERDFTYPSYYDSNRTYTPEGSTFTDTGYLPEGIQPQNDIAADNETAERNAVIKYNGFYIARYEAGDELATSERSSAKDGTLVSKQDKYVYNYIKQVDSKTKAKTMLTSNSNVKVALCSGIQWDMVMKFLDGEEDAKEGTYNVRVVDENRHTGSLAKTGKNEYDKVQNIYDLEGNCTEWVAEKNNTSVPFVVRGGSYFSDSYTRASERVSYGGIASYDYSFRPALYVM